METPQELHYAGHNFEAWVTVTRTGYQLKWTDYVANVWQEDYAQLCMATIRLAALIANEENAECGFAHQEKFEALAEDFLEGVLHG